MCKYAMKIFKGEYACKINGAFCEEYDDICSEGEVFEKNKNRSNDVQGMSSKETRMYSLRTSKKGSLRP